MSRERRELSQAIFLLLYKVEVLGGNGEVRFSPCFQGLGGVSGLWGKVEFFPLRAIVEVWFLKVEVWSSESRSMPTQATEFLVYY